tara:strand:+ start:119 stop:1147 length:1029 start_codon:yes stop_codon:yes gene_type:complete
MLHPRFLPLQGGIEQLTPEWFQQRKGRLTGSKLSNFCFIKTEEEYDNYFAVVFEGAPREPFSDQAKGYMQWGRDHEDVAICNFLDVAPKTLGDIYFAESPFFKHSDPSLGASPDGTYAIYGEDGKIVEEGVVEVKCPGKAPNRPYPHWKYYYVMQTFWECACAGHKNVIAISWGPRNMRAWRYSWDDAYWKVLSNIVTGFRNHVPYEEFKVLQAELIAASNAICDKAENLHPGKGWPQYAHNTEKIKKAIAKFNETAPAADAVTLDSLMSTRDVQFAEIVFAPGTGFYKNKLVPRVGSKDAEREFVVMSVSPRVMVVPGYTSGAEIRIPTDEKIILKIKYYE